MAKGKSSEDLDRALHRMRAEVTAQILVNRRAKFNATEIDVLMKSGKSPKEVSQTIMDKQSAYFKLREWLIVNYRKLSS